MDRLEKIKILFAKFVDVGIEINALYDSHFESNGDPTSKFTGGDAYSQMTHQHEPETYESNIFGTQDAQNSRNEGRSTFIGQEISHSSVADVGLSKWAVYDNHEPETYESNIFGTQDAQNSRNDGRSTFSRQEISHSSVADVADNVTHNSPYKYIIGDEKMSININRQLEVDAVSDHNPNACSKDNIAKGRGRLVNYQSYLYDTKTTERNEDDGHVTNKQREVPRDCDATKLMSLNIKPKQEKGCDNRSMSAQASNQSSKKLCCPFCDKLFVKLALHMERKHRQEPDVDKFSSLPKGSKGRRLIQDALRKIGSFNHNKKSALNNNYLITSRRPNQKFNNSGVRFTTCPYCYGQYRKTGLRFHIQYKCPNKPIACERTKGERVITKKATSVEARHHKDTSPALEKVFTKLHDDEIVRSIKFDWLIVVYGNKLSKKYTKRTSPAMIKNKLRVVGRILHALKNIEPEVTDFAALYLPRHYDSVVKAIQAVARIDEVRNEFIAPATASSSVTAIRQIGEMLIAEYIKKDDRENQRITENFLKLMSTDMHIDINKMVNETQARMARQKKVVLPSSEDVKKLAQYLERQRTECFNELSKAYNFKKWQELSHLTMATIIVFNRRRVGDTENILEDDFTCKEMINESTNEEMMSTLSDQSKQIAKQFSRMKVRGKKNRTVAVLLKASVENCLKLLLSHREEAGISTDNKYLFALPSEIDNDKVVTAGRVLSKFAKACGAKNPSSLNATNLRKHMATVCVSLKLDDTDVADIADFMGHAEKVHREYYRQNTIDRQIVRISKILEAAQGVIDNEDAAQCNQMAGGVKRKMASSDFELEKKSRRVRSKNKD